MNVVVFALALSTLMMVFVTFVALLVSRLVGGRGDAAWHEHQRSRWFFERR